METQPQVVTTVSSQSVAPGTQITDSVKVSGLAGETATVQASLYGPFATRAAIKCTGGAAWTGTIAAAGDGTYVTQPFTVTVPGYYTYYESIAASGFVRATTTKCGDTPETAIVTGTPKVTTQVSAQQTRPGATITDKVVVTGLGALQAQVNVELWGPFPTRADIRCTGTPVLARHRHGKRRRHVHDRAREDHRRRLLHLSTSRSATRRRTAASPASAVRRPRRPSATRRRRSRPR